uniref:Xylulose kinase-1 n=1 Tax=Tanacetum cinerariifolium TaxID=118510 RepID=A0A6L2MSZ6_TANCI|nr:xylulose kinase-1 [Tanacetum cinerariifolium]
MIHEPGDTNREITVTETIHLQTDDELYDKELKQPEWSGHVTIIHQTKDLHIADYTQLYDFLKYNQKEVDELKAERIAKIQDPLALMANSNNPYASPAPHQDLSPFNQSYIQQPISNPEDITDPTNAINMALVLMAKAFKLNYSTPTNNNQRISSNPRNRQIAQPGMNMGQDRQMQMIRGNGGNQFRQYAGQNPGNLNRYNAVQNVGNQVAQNPRVQNDGIQNQIGNGNLVAVRAEENAAGKNGNQIRCYNCRGVGHYARKCTVRPKRRDAAYLQTQLLIAEKEEAGIQLQAKEYDLMAAVADLDEIEEVNANCILMANLQQASTSGTQTDSAPVYDTDGSAEVHENCDDNEIFNMFTQEEQYTELLEPIPESHQVPQNDNDVISEATSVEQSGGTVEQHPVNVEETQSAMASLMFIGFPMTCSDDLSSNDVQKEPMTSQSAFLFPDPTSFSTQQATFTSFSPGQTYVTSEPIGNIKKSIGKDSKGGIIILPPVSFEEHIAVQRETKARTLLLQSLPEDHMDDFHHLDNAREIWLAVKARFGGNEESKKMRKTMLKQEFSKFSVSKEEGLHKGYDRFQKILSQLNQMQAKPDNDDVNMKFLSAFSPSWSQVALTLKTRGGLKYLSM